MNDAVGGKELGMVRGLRIHDLIVPFGVFAGTIQVDLGGFSLLGLQ